MTPNELLEKLAKTRLSNYESRYVFALIRKTFGFHKSDGDYISNSQFVKMTGIRKEHISRTKDILLEKRIIKLAGRKTAINTNYDEWQKLPNQATIAKSGNGVAQRGRIVASSGKNKINLTKEEIKQKKELLFKLAENYKNGDRSKKPFYDDKEMRWSKEKWWVVPKDGSPWLKFGTSETKIEWRDGSSLRSKPR